MTRKPRHTASRAAASESLERRRRYSDAANILRDWYLKRKLQGVMSKNACDNIELAIDDMEAGS